jgi:hypothetical protein
MFMSKAVAEQINSPSQKSSCTTAIAIREQAGFHSPGIIIPESDISAEFLQKLFVKFKIDTVIDEDGELHVPEAFGPTIYIRLEPKRHWIILHTGFETPTLDDGDRLAFANYLSHNLAMAQFAATDGGIGMAFFMYYRGGLSVDQFMAMAQRFGSLACAAMRRCMTFETASARETEEQRQSIRLN